MPHRAFRNLLLATAAALAVAACAADALNLPINAGLASAADQGRWPQAAEVDDTIVGLAFSGGGTRAAAFSHGVLTALDRETIRTGAGPRPLTEAVDFVAGVSGGSVTAAYFGLKGETVSPISAAASSSATPRRASTPRSRSAMSSRS